MHLRLRHPALLWDKKMLDSLGSFMMSSWCSIVKRTRSNCLKYNRHFITGCSEKWRGNKCSKPFKSIKKFKALSLIITQFRWHIYLQNSEKWQTWHKTIEQISEICTLWGVKANQRTIFVMQFISLSNIAGRREEARSIETQHWVQMSISQY